MGEGRRKAKATTSGPSTQASAAHTDQDRSALTILLGNDDLRITDLLPRSQESADTLWLKLRDKNYFTDLADSFIDMGNHVHQRRGDGSSMVEPDDIKKWEKASREVMSFYDGAKGRLGETETINKLQAEFDSWVHLVRSEDPHTSAWECKGSDQVAKTWIAANAVHAELSAKEVEERDHSLHAGDSAVRDEKGSGSVVPLSKTKMKKKKKKAKANPAAPQGSASTFDRAPLTILPNVWDGDDMKPRGKIQQ